MVIPVAGVLHFYLPFRRQAVNPWPGMSDTFPFTFQAFLSRLLLQRAHFHQLPPFPVGETALQKRLPSLRRIPARSGCS